MSLQSAEDLRTEANELMVEDEYQAALAKYNEAIDMEGDDAKCYLPRAGCHLKLKNYDKALADSTEAVRLRPKNHTAFYRLGLSNFHLDKYQAARTALQQAKELGNKRCDLWLRKCDAELEDGDEDVVMHQAAPVANEERERKEATPPQAVQSNGSSSSTSSSSSSSALPAKRLPQPSMKKKPVRTAFIQSDEFVKFTMFAKLKDKKDVLNVSYDKNSFTVDLAMPWGETWSKTVDTWGEIDPAECSYTMNPYKVIVSLKKAQKKLHWESLEKVQVDANVTRRENTQSGVVPDYPSSAKKKIDWDGLDKEVTADMEKEKPEGDQALNKLFSDLYAKGDEDTRRAMVKSMQTSGGTCLSMNWSEVQSTDYESSIQAPQGSEVHRYEV